jgi:hypothetical protein
MRRTMAICAASALAFLCVNTPKAFGQLQLNDTFRVFSPNAYKKPYLGVDGEFTIDTQTITASDPRNPGKVVFKEMEYFSFYRDLAGTMPIAENCRYIYRGAAGDPYYFPTQFKTSIWDLFELASGGDTCKSFSYVILRSPHGNPIHFHMRYGAADSSFRKLLNLSDGPENPGALDPWWSVYCTAGTSGCD